MACNVYVFEQFPDLRTGIRHAYPGGAKREGPSGLTPTYAQRRSNMLSQVKPPFRAEHIGSLLRPRQCLPAPVMKPLDPWGVQLVGISSDATALSAYIPLPERC